MSSSLEPFHRHDPNPAEHDLDPLADSCCICYHPYSLDFMEPEAEEPVQLVCGHVFGATCVGKWVRTNSTCPLCRAELKFQSIIDEEAVVEGFSYHDNISWQDEVNYDSDSEEVEYFNAQQGFETPAQIQYRSAEDIWLTVAYREVTPQLYTPLKPSFSFGDINSVELAVDDCYNELIDCHDELVDCHKQWMSDYLNDGERDNEDAIKFSDVLSY
jgi:hypothetical protein